MFIKGGGFIHCDRRIRGALTLQHLLHQATATAKAGAPTIVLPNSFGPIAGRAAAHLVRRAIADATLIYARETRSQAFMSTLLKREVRLSPDLGRYLNLDKPLDRSATSDTVAITVRPWRFGDRPDPTASYDRYLSAVASLIQYITSIGLVPRIVAHSTGPGPSEDDRIACLALCRRIGDDSLMTEVAGDANALQDFYGDCRFVVGTRFHSVIFALNRGTPAVAIGYGGHKSTILDDMGLGQFRIDASSISSNTLVNVFKKLVLSESDVQDILIQQRSEMVQKRSELISEIQEALAK